MHLQLGTKVLLNNANLSIYPSHKWGVIGANGTGKSSLFKLLLGEIAEDAGELSIPSQWQLAHMAQETKTSEQNAVDFVLDGDAELRRVEKAIEANSQSGEKLGSLYEKMEVIDGYTARSRAQKLLYGLGFSSDDENKTTSSFSGGWRIRLNLARALMCRSDLLLLDEPTNHLDLDATMWLESWLQNYQGTLLVISHDRDFLDNVINNIVSFENSTLVSYKGNYSSFELQRAERLAQQSAAFDKQQQRISEIEDFVRRFRAKATKAKQAQSRLKELERMEKISQAHVDSPFTFRFPEPEKTPQTLVTLSQCNIGYGSTSIVSNIELSIIAGMRIGLLGHNGQGKSTLIKTLANELDLVSGDRSEGAHLKIGYFAQHQLEALDLNASAVVHLQRLTPKATEQEMRTFLGSYGFIGDRVFETIQHFSGGEKARLALAVVAWQKPNFLLLDEPTNHLDLEVRHALTLALQAYSGAIVVVSHDRHLLRNTVDEFILVDSGKISPFKGDLSDYQNWLLKSKSENSSSKTTIDELNDDKNLDKDDKKSQRKASAAKREALKPLTNAIKKLDKEMDTLTVALGAIDTKLADETLYQKDSTELTGILKEQAKLRLSLEECEAQWLEKNEELENFEDQSSN